MNDHIPTEREIEGIFSRLELPGEDPALLRRYLEESHFVERVMSRVRLEAAKSQKAAAWALFALLNLAFLIIFGSNRYIVGNYFAMQDTLSQLFFLFLGISFLGALFGLVLSADTTWIETLPQTLQPLLTRRRHTVRHELSK